MGKRDALGMASGARSESNEGGVYFRKRFDPLGSWGRMLLCLEQHSIGRGLFHDDIEANLLDEAAPLGSGKLGSDGDEAPASPQDAEGVCDVIHPISTLKTNSWARQGLDQRVELPGESSAFFIKSGVGCFLPVVENGYRVGIGFFKNLLGDIHLKMWLPPSLRPLP